MNDTTTTHEYSTIMAAERAATELENSRIELRKVFPPAPSLIDLASCVWLHMRTSELAVLAGRDPYDITESDFEQALQEALCECFRGRQRAVY